MWLVWAVPVFGAIFWWIIWNMTLDAQWQPTDNVTVERILSLTNLEKGETIYDLGCGDGRIVIAAAKKYNAYAKGVEVDPLRFTTCWIRALFAGVTDRVDFILGDMYSVDLSDADVVTIFLSSKANSKLSPKLKRELKEGARIVSYYHPLPKWKPVKTDKSEDNYELYLYSQEN